jgi:hypothetical protein
VRKEIEGLFLKHGKKTGIRRMVFAKNIWPDQKESYPKAQTDLTIKPEGYETRDYDPAGYLQGTQKERWAKQNGKVFFCRYERRWFELISISQKEMVWKFMSSDELKVFRRTGYHSN